MRLKAKTVSFEDMIVNENVDTDDRSLWVLVELKKDVLCDTLMDYLRYILVS